MSQLSIVIVRVVLMSWIVLKSALLCEVLVLCSDELSNPLHKADVVCVVTTCAL